MKKYYEILQIKESASKEEVQSQYEKLSKEFDPKNNEGMEDFFKDELERVNDAYKKIITKIEKIEKIKQEELVKKEEEEKKETEELKENDFRDNHDKYKPKDENNQETSFQSEDTDTNNIKTENKNDNNIVWNIPGLDILASSARFLGIILIIFGVIQVIELAYVYEEFEDIYNKSWYDDDRPKFYFIFIYFALTIAFLFKVGNGLTNFAKNFKASKLSKDNHLLTLSMTGLSKTLKSAFQFILAIVLYCGITFFTYTPGKTESNTHNATVSVIYTSTPFSYLIDKYMERKRDRYRKREKKKNRERY